MKDAFLANLSHELRTPLSAIVGWSQVLRRGPRLADGELQRGLEAIERNARIQAQLIEDLLDMNRITSGKVRLDIRPVDPVAFIEAAIETVRPAAEAKGIRHRQAARSGRRVRSRAIRTGSSRWSGTCCRTPSSSRPAAGGCRSGSSASAPTSRSAWRTPASASAPIFSRTCSSASGSRTPRRRACTGASASASPSSKQLVELHGGTVEARSPGEGRGATFTVSLPLTVDRADVDGWIRRRRQSPRSSCRPPTSPGSRCWWSMISSTRATSCGACSPTAARRCSSRQPRTRRSRSSSTRGRTCS